MRPPKHISHLAPACERLNKHLKLALPFTFPALHALPCTVQPGVVVLLSRPSAKKVLKIQPTPHPRLASKVF